MIVGREDVYELEIDARLRPGPLVIDPAEDTRKELAELLEQLEDLPASDAELENGSQWHYYLCPPCYRQWTDQPFGP